jgi:plastocyanin
VHLAKGNARRTLWSTLAIADYMNSPGEVQSVTFKVPGDYEYICALSMRALAAMILLCD